MAVVAHDAYFSTQPKSQSAIVKSPQWDRSKRLQGGRMQASACHPIDYRAIFGKRGGKWMRMAFVSGDQRRWTMGATWPSAVPMRSNIGAGLGTLPEGMRALTWISPIVPAMGAA